jgi:hypothetical protein
MADPAKFLMQLKPVTHSKAKLLKLVAAYWMGM